MQLFAGTRVIAPHKNSKLFLALLSAYISEVSSTYAVTKEEE
jgi:hypothetical protein